MDKKELSQLTDEELLIEKKKLKKSELFHATYIGFLVGILIFGIVAWSLSSEKHLGFLIPMLIPIGFIYKLIKSPNKNNDLVEILKERNLS
jgi:hypothetical protein